MGLLSSLFSDYIPYSDLPDSQMNRCKAEREYLRKMKKKRNRRRYMEKMDKNRRNYRSQKNPGCAQIVRQETLDRWKKERYSLPTNPIQVLR